MRPITKARRLEKELQEILVAEVERRARKVLRNCVRAGGKPLPSGNVRLRTFRA